MYWDAGFDSWGPPFNVTGQPAAALMTADGQLIEGWYGAPPENVILELIEQNA